MEKNDLLKLKKMYLIEKYEARKLLEYSYYTSYTTEVIPRAFFGAEGEPQERIHWDYHLIQKEAGTLDIGFTIFEVYEKNKNEIINPFPLEINFLIPKHMNFSMRIHRNFWEVVNNISYKDGLDGFCKDHIENDSSIDTLRCYIKLRTIEAERKQGLILNENCKSAQDYIQNQKYSLYYDEKRNRIMDKIINSSKAKFNDCFQPKYIIQIIYENGAVGIKNFTYFYPGNYRLEGIYFQYDADVSNVFSSKQIIGYVVNKVYVKNEAKSSIFRDTCIMRIPFYVSYNQSDFEFINGDYEYRVTLEESKNIFYDSYEEASAFLKSFIASQSFWNDEIYRKLFEVSKNAKKIVESILEYQDFIDETKMIREKTLK